MHLVSLWKLGVTEVSPSAKNRKLGEAFPECRPSIQGRFGAIGSIQCLFFKKLFPEFNTRERNLFF
jgi:hypothetical protein